MQNRAQLPKFEFSRARVKNTFDSKALILKTSGEAPFLATRDERESNSTHQ